MKRLLLILMMFIITFSLKAQSDNSLVFGNKLAKMERMEKAGTILTVIGGISLFTGNILYWKTYNDQNNGEPSDRKGNKYKAVMFGGLGLMAIGIPLWATGKTKIRRLRIEASVVTSKHFASINGAALRLRF